MKGFPPSGRGAGSGDAGFLRERPFRAASRIRSNGRGPLRVTGYGADPAVFLTLLVFLGRHDVYNLRLFSGATDLSPFCTKITGRGAAFFVCAQIGPRLSNSWGCRLSPGGPVPTLHNGSQSSVSSVECPPPLQARPATE